MLKIPENQLDLPLKFDPMLFENEYRDYVLEEYKNKKAAGELLAELLVPTPGNLKSACEKVCERRFDKKDEIILESFFNKRENGSAYLKAIELSKADIYRPLNKYLKEHEVNTALKNINLLAWLIDCPYRPFHPDLKLPAKKTAVKPSSESPFAAIVTERAYTRPLIIAAVVGILSIGIYFAIDKEPKVNGDEDCMIWVEDRYRPVYCKNHSKGYKWPIDHKLVEEFRRITKPDTLTYHSVRKVYYANFNGRQEFFTTDGPFPLDTNRRLLPMTRHILEKYILHIKN